MPDVTDQTVTINIDVAGLLLYYKTDASMDEGAVPYQQNLRAQTFIAGQGDWQISNMRLLVWRDIGTNPGDVTVSIRETDADGFPTDTILASGIFNSNSLPEDILDAIWIDVSLSPLFSLTPGGRYAIVLEAPDAAYPSNLVHFVYNADTDAQNVAFIGEYLRYQDGEWSVGWPTGSANTIFFELHGIGIPPSCIHWTQDPLLRFDVNNDGEITWEDAAEIWQNRDTEVPYNPHYDMNCNGDVDFQDAGLCWTHRTIDPICEEITDETICTQFAGCHWYNGSCHSHPLTYEDFLSPDYEISDSDMSCPDNLPPYLNVEANIIHVINMQALPTTYVRRGVPGIGDFNIWFTYHLANIQVGGDMGIMHFCNNESTVDREQAVINADGIGLYLRQNIYDVDPLPSRYFGLRDYQSGLIDSYGEDLIEGQTYLFNFYRQGTTVHVDVYDESGQNLILSREITGATTTLYNYMLPIMSRGSAGCESAITADLSNLLL